MAVNKDKTITLAFGQKQYKVVTITNSVTFYPGEWLNPPVVHQLCQDPTWSVTMAEDQLISQILQGITGRVISSIPMPGL